MNKRILGGLAAAVMLTGGLAITTGVASATGEAQVEIPEALLEAPSEGARVAKVNEGVCPPYTTGHQSAEQKTVWTYTAPIGKIILNLCVKAGSINSDYGPEEVPVLAGAPSIKFSHSSGKEISHFSVRLGDAPVVWTPPTYPPFDPQPCIEYLMDKQVSTWSNVTGWSPWTDGGAATRAWGDYYNPRTGHHGGTHGQNGDRDYAYISVDSRPITTGDCAVKTPVTPTFNYTPPTCLAAGTAAPNQATGIVWTGPSDGIWTATASLGYVIQGTSTFGPYSTARLQGEQCLTPVTPTIEHTPPTCTTLGVVTPGVNPGYTWTVADGVYSAVPAAGYKIVGPTAFGPYAIDELTDESCPSARPPLVTEWVDGTFKCGDTTVKQTRTVTPYIWVDGEFVLDEKNAMTENQTRDPMEKEQSPCRTQPPVTAVPPATPPTEVVVALPPTPPLTESVVAALPPAQAPTTTAPTPVATIPAAGLPATGSDGIGVTAVIALLVTSLGGAALLAARRRIVTI